METRPQNRVFFPQTALDAWLIDGTVDLRGDELTLLSGGEPGRRYRVTEAVRIVHEVTGATDPNELVGRVKPKTPLVERGAEILESSLLLGDNAYEVVPGWLGEPIGTFDEHVAQAKGSRGDAAPGEPKTDEDLLAAFLLKAL
jgi:hypothetical protein